MCRSNRVKSIFTRHHMWSTVTCIHTCECIMCVCVQQPGVMFAVLAVCGWRGIIVCACTTQHRAAIFQFKFKCVRMHHVLSTNHAHVHNVMYHSTTHLISQAEVKSTLVHEVPHHWEATIFNCPVKACPTNPIHLKLPVSKEGQQVLNTLKGSTRGSSVKGSD